MPLLLGASRGGELQRVTPQQRLINCLLGIRDARKVYPVNLRPYIDHANIAQLKQQMKRGICERENPHSHAFCKSVSVRSKFAMSKIAIELNFSCYSEKFSQM
jgi:hypothetical protein